MKTMSSGTTGSRAARAMSGGCAIEDVLGRRRRQTWPIGHGIVGTEHLRPRASGQMAPPDGAHARCLWFHGTITG